MLSEMAQSASSVTPCKIFFLCISSCRSVAKGDFVGGSICCFYLNPTLARNKESYIKITKPLPSYVMFELEMHKNVLVAEALPQTTGGDYVTFPRP